MRGVKGFAGVLVVVALGACSSGGKHASATTSSSAPSTTSTTVTAATTSTARAASTTTAAIAKNIKVYEECKTPAFEPPAIVMECGDFGLIYATLSWTSWTATQATAVGTMSYKVCQPDCASGGVRDVKGVRITLTRPVKDPNGQLVWSQLQASQVPPGFPHEPMSLPTHPV
ncbi:MAG: hypothetical protein JO248_09470 [Acidimicrobiia bacterium]|nr:hypothetical protein [Acidimicrobiia bacterium]